MVDLRNYVDEAGNEPFRKWVDGLEAWVADVVHDRLERARWGNFGDWKSLAGTGGVNEMRISHGEGWRIYFGWDGMELVILLGGGAKSDQKRDIPRATQLWEQYKTRKEQLLKKERGTKKSELKARSKRLKQEARRRRK